MEMELIVDVPKSPGFRMEITDEYDEITYFPPNEQTISIEIPFRNSGNSDETFTFEFEESNNWDVAGPRMQPVSPFSDGLATFTFSPTFTGNLASDYEETIDILVTDSSNNSYTFQNRLKLDSPKLSVVVILLLSLGIDSQPLGN